MTRDIVILHAPTPLGLKPPAPGRVPGVRRMPDALQQAGLHDALGARWGGIVVPPPYVADRDPQLGVRNLGGIATYSVDLADRIGRLLNEPDFPLVLGGDCSILIGVALALKRRGRYGFIYLDAHSDCQTPEISTTGGIAGMPLAIATGTGPERLTGLEGRSPLVAEEDAVLVGVRDLFDITGNGSPRVDGTDIRVHDLNRIREAGPEQVATEVLAYFEERNLDGLWLHLDADVLDPEIMPAVDSPDPGGLTSQELKALLKAFLQSPHVVGMHLTIYDPERDPDGSAARVLVDIMSEAMGSSSL